MKKFAKRFLSALLVACLLAGMVPMAFAAESVPTVLVDADDDGEYETPIVVYKPKPVAQLNGTTVEVAYHGFRDCTYTAIAVYTADGQMTDVQVFEGTEEALSIELDAIPESGYVKVMYLDENYAPCYKAQELR